MAEGQGECETRNDPPKPRELPDRHGELKYRANSLRFWRKVLVVVGVLTILFSLLLALATSLSVPFALPSQAWFGVVALFIAASLCGGAAAALPVGRTDYQIQEIEDEADLQAMTTTSHEQKAFKLLRIQQNQLTQFLRLILRQSSLIFFTGILAMGVGVGVVVFAIWQAKNTGGGDVTEKWVIGVLGSVGAILTNFVAALYLKMFSDIGAAVKEAMSVLAKSTNVNLANVVVSKINDPDQSIRNNAYKELAGNIASRS